MRTSYFRKRNTGLLEGSRFYAAIIAVVLLILFIVRLAWPAGFTALFTPLWSAGSALSGGLRDAEANFKNPATLQAEVDVLRAERDALQLENRALAERLADLSAFGTTTSGDVHAGVMARPPVSAYDTLIVSIPVPVAPGTLALAPGNVPLGTLTDATDGRGHVALYSSSGRATEGWVGTERIPVTLIGRGAGAFFAEIPHDAGIVVGDGVYLPGPGALPAGVVERIDSDPASPNAKLFIRPAVNVFSLTWVMLRPFP